MSVVVGDTRYTYVKETPKKAEDKKKAEKK